MQGDGGGGTCRATKGLADREAPGGAWAIQLPQPPPPMPRVAQPTVPWSCGSEDPQGPEWPGLC